MRRTVLSLIGLACLVFGVLFLLQGMGVVRWPASSFMIDARVWVVRGMVLALLGVVFLVAGRLDRWR